MSWHPALQYNAIICRYNEIATKGRNRVSFEDLLCEALRRAFASIGKLHLEKSHGRLFLIPTDKTVLTPADLDTIRSATPRIAGVASVSPGFLLPTDMDAITETVMTAMPALHDALVNAQPPLPHTYATRAHRANKGFPVSSSEIEIAFAHKILPLYSDLSLDLHNPELKVEVEIRHKQAFVCFERIEGPGGLPIGSAGRVLCLLSGGIDSPVASFQMMRRGCSVDFITFHSEPYTPPEYLTKIGLIARKLNEFQRFGRLIAVNLLPAQKAIRDNCRSKYRTILYRRFMLRIAEFCAKLGHDRALVTGDNIGQVASQTLDNMAVINAATNLMVLRPLLTYDKLDSVEMARKIGTYDLSCQQVPDSCTVFAPDDPATSSEIIYLQREERNLDVDSLVIQCLELAVIINTSTLENIPLKELFPWTPDDLHKEFYQNPLHDIQHSFTE